MKHVLIIMFVSLLLMGCTSNSTKLAQEGSMRTQAVKDGVVNTLHRALSRENYETAVLSIEMELMKSGASPDLISKIKPKVREFAQKRDMSTSVLLDNEKANTMKAVTVDAKLWSEQGILNYFGERLSEDGEKFWKAWDVAKKTYDEKKEPKTE